MKKVVLSIFIFLSVVSCKSKVEENKPEDTPIESVFKVSGLNDTVKANSVSMIIRLDGIQSVYLNKADSTVSVKADVGVIDQQRIKNEIEKCGVEIIKVFK